jgi:thiol-disulfide isomerase/thioredoxin
MLDYNICITHQEIFIMTKTLGIIIVIVVLIGGWSLFDDRMPVSDTLRESASMSEKQDVILDAVESTDASVMKEESEASMMTGSSGVVLAGDSSPLLDFTKADYDKAKVSDKLVVLYFYASWCPLCRAEFPKMQSAFDALSGEQVVGFRVNYNDGDTDMYEKNLARDFGIAYQHTKVFVRGGKQVLKSPETWDEARYASEIAKALK